MGEIILELREDKADGGFVATALGHAIATQDDSVEELREMVRDAVRCHFGDGAPGTMSKIIRLTTTMEGTHHVTAPNRHSLKTGTLLCGVLKPVATHHKITVEDVLAKLEL